MAVIAFRAGGFNLVVLSHENLPRQHRTPPDAGAIGKGSCRTRARIFLEGNPGKMLPKNELTGHSGAQMVLDLTTVTFSPARFFE